MQHVMSYRWPPSLNTCLVRVAKAVDACSSIGNVGELHRALRDQKSKGKATGLSGGKLSQVF